MIKGAIFDLDGTILDSMFIWDNIGEDYLRHIGYEPKEDINQVFKSFSLYQSACFYKREYNVPMTVDEIMAGVNKMVEDYYFHSVPAKDGVKNFLEELSLKGVKMCIATATDRYQVEAALKRLGLEMFFSEIFTCTEVGSGKEQPYVYRKAMEHLGTSRENTVVFEDAFHGIVTAHNDGFITVGVYDKSVKEQEKVRMISDMYLENFLETEEFWKFADKG